MSWDYELVIRFDESKPFDEIAMDLILRAGKSLSFKGIVNLYLYKEQKINHILSEDGQGSEVDITPLEKLEAEGDNLLNIDDVSGLVRKHISDDLLIESFLVVPRYHRAGMKANISGIEYIDYGLGEVVLEDANMILSLYGDGVIDFASDYSDKPRAGAVCNARNGHKYSVPSRGDDAMQNMELLVHELFSLIPAGIASIVAIDRENSSDPTTSSLRFCRDLLDFIKDIHGERKKPLGNYSKIDVLAAAEECDNINFYYSKEGLMIYSQAGSGGSLKAFYEILAAKING